MRKPRPDEQSGQKKEHRHEEAVGGGNHRIEADPGLRIGVTEVGIGNDRVMDEHHQRQEGAGAIEREVSRGSFRRRVGFGHRRGAGN